MKKIFKIFLYFILAILGLVLILLIFTQTSWFRDILKGQVETIVSNQLNGNFTIGEIEGNFYEHLEVFKLRIEQNDTTLLYVDNVSLDYNLSGVLFKNINIDLIKIDSIYLFLDQEADSSWNISKLLKHNGQEENDTSASEFDWNIGLDLFEILRTEVEISALSSSSNIPSRIGNINLSASGSLSLEQKSFIINSLTLETENPDFVLKDLELSTTADQNKIVIDNFNLTTLYNKVELTAEYFLNKSDRSTLKLSTAPINFKEFKPFLPELSIDAKPTINIDGKYNGSKVNIDASIKDETQSILVKGFADNIKSIPSYALEINVNSVDLDQWTENKNLNSEINGDINLKGSGNSIQSLDLSAILNIHESRIAKLKIDSLMINTVLRNEELISKIMLNTEFAELSGGINLKGIQKENIFALKLDLCNVNIAPIINDEEYNSDINFSLSATGSGLEPSEMNADIIFDMNKSSFQNYSINSIDSKINVGNGIYNIDKFNFLTDYADLNISGKLSPEYINDIRFKLITKDLSLLPNLDQFDYVSLIGELSGSVQGYIDSLTSKINYSFNDVTFQNNSLENFNGIIDFRKNKDNLSGNITTALKNIYADGFSIENIELKSGFTKNKIDAELIMVINDTSNAEIKSEVIIDSVTTVYLNDFNFEISDYEWQNLKDTMIVMIDGGKYVFKDFELSNGQQSIFIKGYLDQETENNLSINIKDLDIGELLRTVNKDLNLLAKINLDLDLKGTLNNPNLKGELGIADFNYNNDIQGTVDAEFGVEDKKFEYGLSLLMNNNEIISNGFLPIDLEKEDTTSIIPWDKPLDINLKLDIPNLSLISKYIDPLDKFEGKVESELRLTNNINNLDLEGFFKLNDASLSSEVYGVSYNKINLNFDAEGKKYQLKNLSIENNEGKLNVDGSAEFKEGIISGRPDYIEINLAAKEFVIANSRNLEAKIDGNINAITKLGNTKFDGDIKVLRSRVYLPYFTETTSGKETDGSKPLLLKELEKLREVNDSTLIISSKSKNESEFENKILKNITGKFKLRLPKNTWIVSPDLNIELSGEVDVVKNGDVFELYGNLETVRGKLSVYGKEFSITTGGIIFNGGSELNPGLNIQLEYTFRGTDKEKRSFELFINGTAKKPELSFKIDDNVIDEGNAISYLLFGKSLDELSQSQKSNVKNSNEDLAKTIAGNLVAAQLKNSIGDALGLDVIEINGEDNWQQASFTAGKYLTDDLYVSYEEGFGSSETNEVSPTIITLGYGLTSFLYLQLVEGNDKTSGFDLIFKFDF